MAAPPPAPPRPSTSEPAVVPTTRKKSAKPSALASHSHYFAEYNCSFGKLLLEFEDNALTAIHFPSHPTPKLSASLVVDRSHPTVGLVSAQLDEYFAGMRTIFDFEMRFKGSEFDERVWTALTKVPHGSTVSYAQLAQAIGSPGAARAVGNAVGRNAMPICVPCHRVIATDGTIGGFSLGLQCKRQLLDLEKIKVKDVVKAAAKRRRQTPSPAV